MVNHPLFSIAVGAMLGFLSGLGTGGGSLLILYLTLVLNMDPHTARTINLMFFVPSALIACLFRWQQGRLRIRTLLPGVLAGCASAGLFSNLAGSLSAPLLRKLFGLLLLATGIRELCYRPRKAK